MSALPDPIVRRLVRQLQEEEMDVYTMMLYTMGREDIEYFDPKDREEVKRIFSVLMDDTKHHQEILRLMIELGKD